MWKNCTFLNVGLKEFALFNMRLLKSREILREDKLKKHGGAV